MIGTQIDEKEFTNCNRSENLNNVIIARLLGILLLLNLLERNEKKYCAFLFYNFRKLHIIKNDFVNKFSLNFLKNKFTVSNRYKKRNF